MRRYEPERTVHVLVLDGLRWPAADGVRTWSVDELTFPGPSWLATAASHPGHRNDALAGPLVAAVLAAGASAVAYVDPSAALVGPLTELEQALADHPLVLVGQASPDGDEHDETLGAASVVNSRILAARAGAAVDAILADWPQWAEPEQNGPEVFARNAVQRYLDRVAAWSTDAVVLDHPGYGLNGLRLDGREIAADADGTVTVDGLPLRHLDLAGFDVNRPYLLPGRDGDGPRVPDFPALAELLRAYVDDRSAVDIDVVRRDPAVVRPLNELRRDLARQAYEDGILVHDLASAEGSAAFEAWLAEPAERGSAAGLTRQHEAIWAARGDLREAYPHLEGADAAGFAGWLRAYGEAQCGLRPAELPATDEPEPEAVGPTTDDLAWGVNVAGFFRSELGLGEAARLLVSGLDAASIPALPVQGQLVPPCRQEAEFTFGAPDASPYPINIICMNGDAIDPFRREAPGFFEKRHTIALWWWELVDAFPPDWRPAFDDIDEVWVATQHIYDAIAPHSPVPVLKVPMPVTVPRLRPFTRTALGVPEDGFVFMFVYDYHSTSARKNPLGLIRAFRKAFPVGSGAKLVLKCINANKMRDHHDAVLFEIGDDPDITVIDRYVTADEKNALIGACDCYVSLHRSEGFGLTPAEAMLLGKPVIATRYGGTLDFMTDENSYLVDHRWTTVGSGAHPYPPDARWAEPDISHAARLMREVFENQDEARRRGARARRDMEERHSPAVAGAAMRVRLREIYDTMQDEGRTAMRVSSLPVPDRGELAARITRGIPDVIGRGKAVKSPLRQSVGRVLEPWARHYDRIHADLLSGLGDVETTLSAAAAELDGRRREEVAQTLAALRRVRNDLGDYGRHLGEHDQRLDAIEARLAALEPDFEQHLAEHRALPFVAEERAFERWSDERLGAVEGFRTPSATDAVDGYRTFEDAFRGDTARVRELQAAYVALLDGCGPVVDCGCGRGELLALLGEAGIEARGVDGDPGMLAVARDAGLDVIEADAVAYLESLEPGGLGAVTALEVIEHLPEPALRRFFAAAFRALRPDGTLIVETVNPHVVHALKAFWLDPTHQHPLFPEVVLELCRQAGFGEGAVFHPTGTGDVEADRYREPAYAVLARRAP